MVAAAAAEVVPVGGAAAVVDMMAMERGKVGRKRYAMWAALGGELQVNTGAHGA